MHDFDRPPAFVLKVRGGAATYKKHDGKTGTAGKGALVGEEAAFTVAATQDQTLFVPVDFRHGSNQPGVLDETEYVVRRLTPTECERLQGFSDGWTDLTGDDPDSILGLMPQHETSDEKQKTLLERKVRKWCKECPDGPRYKACGNSMAVPVMRWIGERIQLVDDMLHEHGRIGDGAPEL